MNAKEVNLSNISEWAPGTQEPDLRTAINDVQEAFEIYRDECDQSVHDNESYCEWLINNIGAGPSDIGSELQCEKEAMVDFYNSHGEYRMSDNISVFDVFEYLIDNINPVLIETVKKSNDVYLESYGETIRWFNDFNPIRTIDTLPVNDSWMKEWRYMDNILTVHTLNGETYSYPCSIEKAKEFAYGDKNFVLAELGRDMK